MTKIISFLFGVFLSLGIGQNARAETFKKAPKTIDASVALSLSSASEQYDHDGEAFELLDGDGEYSQWAAHFRLEYTPVENLGLFVETDLKDRTLSGPTFEAGVSGFGDVRFGADYILTSDKSPVGFVMGASITAPTGYSPNLGDFVPVLGNGVNVYEISLRLGQKFDGGVHFELATGYRLRGGRAPRGGGPTLSYSDQVPVGAKLGYWVMPKLSVAGVVQAKFSISEPQKIEHVEFVTRAESFTAGGLELAYVLDDTFYLGAHALLDLLGRNRLVTTRLGLNFGMVLEVGN